jgi:hypothetical protein
VEVQTWSEVSCPYDGQAHLLTLVYHRGHIAGRYAERRCRSYNGDLRKDKIVTVSENVSNKAEFAKPTTRESNISSLGHGVLS